MPSQHYNVKMTLPDDYVVASTGECQNMDKMLTSPQNQTSTQASNNTGTEPVEIITLAEANANAKSKKSKSTKTFN
mgnify:CR=1 FL=1